MAYILIIMLVGQGSAVATAEFSSMERCNAAGMAARESRDRPGSGYQTYYVCAPK